MLDAFKKYQAQTTEHPLGLIIKKAKGSYIFDDKGNKYLDFVAKNENSGDLQGT